jgi:hypothetical protein
MAGFKVEDFRMISGPECPVAVEGDGDSSYREAIESGMFMQAIQGLSGTMTRHIEGTKAGLTDERIAELREKAAKAWGEGSEEAEYTRNNPDLAKAVHDCELRIQMGECALHSLRKK